MPILQRPKKSIKLVLPPRKATLAAKTNVLVIGGGPAGIGAALGAAKAGADVVLVERFGFLGGNATAALVMPLMSFHTENHPVEHSVTGKDIFPADHGPGEPVIAGALSEFLERLVQSGGAIAPSPETGYVTPFDPEIFKMAALEVMDRYNVKMLFHSFASGIFASNGTTGIVLETKSGPLVIVADTLIDCTGDGDIAVSAGAKFSLGRAIDNLVQPMSLMFRIVEFQKIAFQNYVKDHPDQWKGVYGLWDLIKKATQEGALELPRENMLFFATPHSHELSVNSTRITKVLGTDVWDLSYAEWEGRRQIKQISAFLKQYVPGFENSYVAQTGTTIGIRETRRVIGDYVLTAEDIIGARKFDDVIARCSYPIDVHNPIGKGTILRKLPAGEAYDIPMRCLIPKSIDNVLVAGRCISGDHVAHSSYRVMPAAMATGQAAGVAAAIAGKKGITPRQVDVEDVQRELIIQGADLGKMKY